MIYPFGIDKESSILDAAISTGIVEKSGAWFKFADKQLAQVEILQLHCLKRIKS
jgi:recombination protein RecA